jgi:peptidoglycan/xylan/chitin deacetylase (PgdA/CDA1 family)
MSPPELNGHRATVCISADFDAMSIWMTWGARGARALSRGEFGPTIAAPRMLELFERYSVPTTWFIPGHTAESWPEITRSIADRGHEIGNHGYLHEAFDQLSLDQVAGVVRKASDALERLTGQRPRGMRVPAGDFDGSLLEFLVGEGFSYDSSLLGGDFAPYWCRGEDELPEDGPVRFGPTLDLVELPIGFITNDFNHFEFNYANPALVGHDAPSVVEEIWCSQFDYMYDHCPGGSLILTLHPQTIGHGLRIAMLERFLQHCMSRPGTRFATHETVVGEFRRRTQHPGAVGAQVQPARG